MKTIKQLCLVAVFFVAATSFDSCSDKLAPTATPPVVAPFQSLDTLATNDWWNRRPNAIIDLKVDRDNLIAFGIYTVSNRTLKLSAQFFPLYPNESRNVSLEINDGASWKEIATGQINDIGWSALFRIEDWDDTKNVEYRLRHGKNASFSGLIRKNPTDKNEIKLAALSCNSNNDRGMRDNFVRNINHQDPDLVFFAGDQSYDHREHTAAWLKFGIQFRDIFRNRPCITIPDDHDIGQGNLWGEGGIKAKDKEGSDGGYFWDADYVKMVERCQTSHLPDPYDSAPIAQDINVYYTKLVLGNVNFAIIEDRKFKTGPKGEIPQQGPRPDHITNPNYNPESINKLGLELLGERQLAFLDDWAKEKDQHAFMAVLSQTGFCGGAHLHGRNRDRLHADLDSNGWPQSGRNAALEVIRKANAVHIGGDQHLATVIQHGIQEWEDGPWAFIVPAIVNDYYSRWWCPEGEQAGENSNHVLPWTGRHLDGFDNKITMHSYANPDQQANGSGYGIVRFNKEFGQVIFECWPADEDVTLQDPKQFIGWPVVIDVNNSKRID